jgi:ribosomal protein S18 acetylase RimI-like enzyme
MTTERVRELERTVVEAWPASESLELDGWLLRSSGGPTNRGNSVAALEDGSAFSLKQRIERTEAWYRERERPVMFQVGPCSAPSGLDTALAARGYHRRGESLLMTASSAAVGARTLGRSQVDVASSPSAAWLGIAAQASRFAASQDVLMGFLERLATRARFVTAYDERSEPAATCLGIISEQRVGVYSMLTLPEQRRRGAARAVLHALAQSALAQQIPELYLMVEQENLGARALYAHSGFQDAYRYHYRVLGSAAR